MLVPGEGRLELNVSLRRLPVRLESIEVRALPPIPGAERDSSQFPDRDISIAAIRNHPLLAEPDPLQAIGGGSVVLAPESPNGVHVRGGASDQTGYLLDGIPVFNPYHSAGLFGAWNPDALASVRLSSTAPSPALPNTLSGTVAATTRTPGPRFQAQGSAATTQARVDRFPGWGRTTRYSLMYRAAHATRWMTVIPTKPAITVKSAGIRSGKRKKSE